MLDRIILTVSNILWANLVSADGRRVHCWVRVLLLCSHLLVVLGNASGSLEGDVCK